MTYDKDNIFAKLLRNEIPGERVYEDEHTLAFMDIMPRADGHTLVIPKTPAVNMLDASPEQLAACLQTVQKVSHAMIRGLGATGFTIQQFNGADGGQEVFHLHYHVIPRQSGESMRRPGKMENPETLKAIAQKIRDGFE